MTVRHDSPPSAPTRVRKHLTLAIGAVAATASLALATALTVAGVPTNADGTVHVWGWNNAGQAEIPEALADQAVSAVAGEVYMLWQSPPTAPATLGETTEPDSPLFLATSLITR